MKKLTLSLPLVLFHKVKMIAEQRKTTIQNAALFLVEEGGSTPAKKERKSLAASSF